MNPSPAIPSASDSSTGASTVRTQYVVRIASTAALGGFLFGFDSAVINGAVSGIQTTFAASSAVTGFAVASLLIGCAIGAIVAGRLADRFGRRPAMLVTAVLFAGTAIWSGFAGGPAELTLARLLGGLAVGVASVVCPAYIAEIAPAHMRGRLASLQQLGIVLGIFVALLSDHLLAQAAGGVTAPLWSGLAAWRWMFIVSVVPAVLFGLALLTAPESPRYLVSRGRNAEALGVLTRIEPSTASEVALQIRRTVETEQVPRLADLRTNSGNLRQIVWVGIALSALQQFVGINTIFYYGAVLWETVGFTTADSLLINVVTGVVNIVATLVAMAVVDKIGRRPLLLAGSIGMAVTLGTLVVVFATAGVGPDGKMVLSDFAGVVALAAANLYVLAFGISWGPCVWILLGEMFPNRLRGAAMAVAVFAQWVANWLVTASFPAVVSTIGPALAYAQAFVCAVISFFFVRALVPETKGRTLEEM